MGQRDSFVQSTSNFAQIVFNRVDGRRYRNSSPNEVRFRLVNEKFWKSYNFVYTGGWIMFYA